MTDTEIREAVEHFNKFPLGKTDQQNLDVLLSLAESYLKVEGLPEKKEHEHWCPPISCECGKIYFNEAIDLCRLAIAKLYLKRSELPDESEIKELLRETNKGERNDKNTRSKR